MTAVAVGIDIGGTKIAAAVVSANGAVLRKEVVETPTAEGPEAVLGAARELAHGSLGWAGLGVGTHLTLI